MDKGHVEIAKEIMDAVAHCNGWVNRWNPMKYNDYWLKKLALCAGKFFDKYPQYINFEDIQLMCDGGIDDVEEKFGRLEGFNELTKCINGYFDRGKQ